MSFLSIASAGTKNINKVHVLLPTMPRPFAGGIGWPGKQNATNRTPVPVGYPSVKLATVVTCYLLLSAVY